MWILAQADQSMPLSTASTFTMPLTWTIPRQQAPPTVIMSKPVLKAKEVISFTKSEGMSGLGAKQAALGDDQLAQV
jgi:hypothetical protein